MRPRLIIIPILAALLFGCSSHSEEKHETIRIISWGGIAADKADTLYSLAKECCFDMHLGLYRAQESAIASMDAAARKGIDVIISFPQIKDSTESAVALIKDHPALYAYHLKDEPDTSDFSWLADLSEKIKVVDSKRLYTGINYPLLRYSDILLMYAEASLEYTGTVSQEAYDCVKAVRDRAAVKTNEFSSYDVPSFREFVRNERGRELCFEGIRKYDLIRWGIFVEAMNGYVKDATDERWSGSAKASYASAIGSAVQPKHVVLPVPSVELGVNNLLVQNPLW